MSSSSPALTKRLVQELKSYSKSPQEEYLERLGPVSDDNLTEWEAVLNGVPDSPYEEHWSPAYTLAATMGAVYQLLTDPGVDSPLNVDVAALIREEDEVAWDALVRYWTGREVYRGE
ncbi:hypothetical protein KEM54_000026 [Ascosphaera aggregata]|nr:hypothetical protein KEM54_000026 [Ascosphaera aggregata]